MAGGFGVNNIEAQQRQMSADSFKKTGLGTPAISGSAASFYSVTDNGTGDYSFARKAAAGGAFAQIPEVMVTCTTDNRIAKLGTVSASSIQVLTEDLSGSAAEADFHIVIFGCDARDLIGI